eukprot:9033087-Prorocentrum_lima.AAC.1
MRSSPGTWGHRQRGVAGSTQIRRTRSHAPPCRHVTSPFADGACHLLGRERRPSCSAACGNCLANVLT